MRIPQESTLLSSYKSSMPLPPLRPDHLVTYPYTSTIIMYIPRTISIIASSFTLAIVIIAFAFFSHFEWHQYKQTRQYRPPSWEYILSILITAVTSTAIMGFSISLLLFSVSYNEKWIEVLLLLSGRVLLMQHVRIHFQSQTIY